MVDYHDLYWRIIFYFRDWDVFICRKRMRKDFIALLKYTLKPITNTWNHLMIVNQVNLWYILTQIIYMVGQWVNIFLKVNLNG